MEIIKERILMTMNTKVVLLLIALAAHIGFSAPPADLQVNCDASDGWRIRSEWMDRGEDGEYVIRLENDREAPPPRFDVTFGLPQLDAHHKWSVWKERVTIPPNWSCRTESRLCYGLPVVAFLNDNDRNRICVSVSEAKRTVTIDAGVREEDNRIVWKIGFFSEPEAPLARYEVRLRVDRRDVAFWRSIREGVRWIEEISALAPMPPPPEAFDPLYSSWYAFHQNVFADELEDECRDAANIGMKTVIVDDGWQTDDNKRGYAYAGDWEVSRRRFPDMAAHVRKIHELGMKYMVWYGVPMMGFKSKNYGRFKGKYLKTADGPLASYSCLDPRFPEVRDYLCGIYERAVREWDIDGLKLDFVDTIGFAGPDPAVRENYAGRDIKSLPEAVDRLLSEIRVRTTAIKPDFLIEFRQDYTGPAVRQYCNMLRAADCGGDLLANRCRIANLRLTSGLTPVHADMLEWNAAETVENAARFVLSSIFAAIQYSVRLKKIPMPHHRMIAHWIAFSQRHRETLLKGDFRPHHFEANYPWIEAESESERIVGVYTGGMRIPIDASKKVNYVLNGTGIGEVLVDAATATSVEVFDTFGQLVGRQEMTKGLNDITMPVSGYLRCADPSFAAKEHAVIHSERADGRYVATRGVVQNLLRETHESLAFDGSMPAERFADWRTSVRTQLRNLLAFPDLPAAPAAKLIGRENRDGYVLEKWEHYPMSNVVVPYLVLVPNSVVNGAVAPAVLCLPGTSMTKESSAGEPELNEASAIYDKFVPENRMALQYCRAGFVAVAVDNPGVGETSDLERLVGGRGRHLREITAFGHFLFNLGWSYMGYASYMNHRLLEVLRRDPRIDRTRIALSGHSLGGWMVAFLAALNEDVAAAVVNQQVYRWHEAVKTMTCPDAAGDRPEMLGFGVFYFIPGLYQYMDMPDVCAAIAPRPLLLCEGVPEHDRKDVFLPAWEKAGVPDALRIVPFEKYKEVTSRFDGIPPEGLGSIEELYGYYSNDYPQHYFKGTIAIPWLTDVFGKVKDRLQH